MSFFFFNDTATTEIYTLSLHDALPISSRQWRTRSRLRSAPAKQSAMVVSGWFSYLPGEDIRMGWFTRSEEHTSELQSRLHLVCRLLLEKKKKTRMTAQN